MEFTEFANLLKPIIGGSYNTKRFTRTLFESMMTEDGSLQIEDISDETFKSYYNGKTAITKIAQRVLANLEDENFVEYLNGFGDATTQELVTTFESYIDDINLMNASRKITDLFLEILRNAASSEKKKSTPKSTKKEEKTPHDILSESILASGKVLADTWGKAMENLAAEIDSSNTPKVSKVPVLNEDVLNDKDSAFLDRFKNEAEPILEYCIEHDPSGEWTKISLADEINDFLASWKYDVRKIKDNTFRTLVLDTLNVLADYTYYLSDKFLRLIPDRNILWFRNESWEEGEQLRNVLQPESYKKRCEMRDIYMRLYPIPEDNVGTDSIELPEEQPSKKSTYSSSDKALLQEFTSDYDEIMVKLISEDYASSLIDMSLPMKIDDLYKNKWISKADTFIDLTLKSNVFALLGELNTLNNSFSDGATEISNIKKTRIKIRNLYVKLHPDTFSDTIPYDAFIDDWNDEEY